MRLIFLGAPGVGKGTQAARLSKLHGVPHIATGDMLRSAVSRKTPAGLAVKSYLDEGKLVPDSVVIDIVRERLDEADTRAGFVLDGFPRTVVQADALADVLVKKKVEMTRAIFFSLDESVLVERISGRRSCPACSTVYHLVHYPPKREDVCDCGATLVHRKDDAPETVKARLVVYHSETTPLVHYYQAKNLLAQIDAAGTPEMVAKRVEAAISASACGG